MIVVDASALFEVLLLKGGAEAIEDRLFDPSETLHAPHLLDVEIAHAIRRYALAGEIDDERGREVLADLIDFPIRRYPHRLLLAQAWAWRHNLTAYDAVYVALAELLNATLLTRDQRLAVAAQSLARIELV